MWCELDAAGSPTAGSPPEPVPAPTQTWDPAATPGLAPGPAQYPAGRGGAASGLSFSVHEFAELSDGREILLLDDRGWGMSGGGRTPEEHLSQLTIEEIERGVYNVLLPDWADADHPLPPDLAAVEGSGGAQDWDMLVERLRAFGVTTTPAELRSVPRRVDLGDRLRERLAAAAD